MAAVSVQKVELAEILQSKFTALFHDCTSLQTGELDMDENQVLSSATTKCQNCLRILDNSKENLTKQACLTLVRDFAQAMMDQTYVVECRVVNEEFPEKDYKHRISKLIGQLKQPEDIAKDLQCAFGKERKIEEILGIEMSECLHWRKGALLYMLCHTVYNDQERWKRSASNFMKECSDGVRFLLLMLSVRAPLSDTDSMEIRDYDTAALLSQGIFSDTHMLALMYIGELCYWHWKTAIGIYQGPDHPSTLELPATGRQCLEKYIETCKGPLKGKGWDYERAEQLLGDMRT